MPEIRGEKLAPNTTCSALREPASLLRGLYSYGVVAGAAMSNKLAGIGQASDELFVELADSSFPAQVFVKYSNSAVIFTTGRDILEELLPAFGCDLLKIGAYISSRRLQASDRSLTVTVATDPSRSLHSLCAQKSSPATRRH